MLTKLRKVMAVLAFLSLSMAAVPYFENALAASGRDCDTNAVIKCGVLSKSELYDALNHGGSGPNQSSTQLKALFGMFGLSNLRDIDIMKEGTVTKSGNVIVGGKTVATNVKSIGRHYMSGSTQVPGVNYPLYMRAPSVSFNSNSLSAWVLMNDDGSMALAVIKSCGNIVPGVGKRVPTFSAYALKWLDENGNGKWDQDENTRIPGVTFKLTGNGITKTGVTDKAGYVWFRGLKAGTYTITEMVPTGWRATTPTSKTIKVDRNNVGATFGNKKIEQAKVSLKIIKFEDCNENKTIDEDEKLLADWEFKITGPNNYSKTVKTGENGIVELTDLAPGRYTVTEMLKTGWKNTTALTQTLDIQKNLGVFEFGNKKVEVEKKVNIKVIKFEDKNGNKSKDGDESYLSGWEFKVTGPEGFSKTITTDQNGCAELKDLKAGDYTVTEVLKSGWENTTGLSKTKEVKEGTGTFEFGNKKVEVPAKKVNLKVLKYEDKDEDKILDGDEKLLSGWEFEIKGPNNFHKDVVTGNNGVIELTNLTPGTYTATEKLQDGWRNITALTQSVKVKEGTGVLQFGNKKKEVVPEAKKVSIKIFKFEDKDGDKVIDGDEPLLAGWEFKVEGPNGFSKIVKTGANGIVELTDLEPGNYKVTEVLREGWTNTTLLTQTLDIEKGTGVFQFGNKKNAKPVTPSSTPTVTPTPAPETLPVTGPEAAAAGMIGTISLGGAAAYLRRSKMTLKNSLRKLK